MASDRLQALFDEMDAHLLHDERPSLYITERSNEPIFRVPPFDGLIALQKTPQSPAHHKEGSAWNHTLLVVDRAAEERKKSREPRVLMWAALLHDIGKPLTTREHKGSGKITSYNHEKVGAAMAERFLRHFEADEAFVQRVTALVRYHMEILFVVKGLPFGDAAGMRTQTDVNEVALLGFADRMGRFGADRELEEENIAVFLHKCSMAAQTIPR